MTHEEHEEAQRYEESEYAGLSDDLLADKLRGTISGRRSISHQADYLAEAAARILERVVWRFPKGQEPKP